MVLHGRISMFHGYVPENGVARQLRGVEQHFQVHHIVNDNREFPFVPVVIPRTDAAHLRIETGDEAPGCLYHYIFIGPLACQLPCLAEAVAYHKAQIMCAFVPFGFFHRPCP